MATTGGTLDATACRPVAERLSCHDLAMSDLERRSGSRLSRRQRERRAYNLVLAGGVFGVVAVVTALLALFTSFGWGIPIIAAVLAVLCTVMFRRTVN
jgi:hypothetical protein